LETKLRCLMFVRVGFALVLLLVIVIVLVLVTMPFSMMMVMVMIVMMVMVVMIVMMVIMMIMMMLVFMPMIMIMVVPVVVVVMMMLLMGVRMLGRNMRMACFPFRDILVHRTDDDPQHVRPVRQIAGTGSVPDGLDDHRRQPFGEVVYDAGHDPGPGRRSHLHRIVGRRDRQTAHHLERSRRRNGV